MLHYVQGNLPYLMKTMDATYKCMLPGIQLMAIFNDNVQVFVAIGLLPENGSAILACLTYKVIAQ